MIKQLQPDRLVLISSVVLISNIKKTNTRQKINRNGEYMVTIEQIFFLVGEH
jgi:hypothetical protein